MVKKASKPVSPLPTKMGALYKEVLERIVDINSEKVTKEQIASAFAGHDLESIPSIISVMKNKRWIKSNPQNSGYYALTGTGRAIYDNLPTMTIVKRYGVKSRLPKHEEAAPPPPPTINISPKANTLADTITDVLEENAQYRELLLNLHKTIETALGLNTETKE